MAEGVVMMVLRGIQVLQPLGNLVFENAMFVKGVGDQVEDTEKELRLMSSYLKDADARQEEDKQIRIWVDEVREAAYNLEDLIESFVLKVVLKKEGSKWIVFKRNACFLCKEGVHRYTIGSDIEKITTKLSKLRLKMQNYDVRQWNGSEEGGGVFARQREHRLTYPHVKDDHDLVGIGKAVDELVGHLLQVTQVRSCRVVSIWGMGGLGKTTLAKKVYNDERIKKHFDRVAWVSVSQQFEGIVIMRDIYKQLRSASEGERKQIDDLNSRELAEKLYHFQGEKKCLVVLDDIWTLDAWNYLKGGFPVNEGTSSRIILTTRYRELAAAAANKNGLSYESQALGDDDSWNLFRKIAFSEVDETETGIKSRKEELGRSMLRQCVGLPLAIVVLAGLLSRKHTVNEWEIVQQNVDLHIRRGADIDQEYTGHSHKGVLWILALSFQNLSYRLKLCFLYLSHYPEDYEISVEQLLYLWMAEGFITSTTSSEKLEDIAYSCLSELVARCMIQVGKIGITGRIKTCRLHDLIRDLCVSKAQEENFFHFGNFSTGTIRSTNTSQDGRVRRLAIYLDDKEVDQLLHTKRGNHLRSLLFFNPGFWTINNKCGIRCVFSDWKLLRVLKLERVILERTCRTIGDLVHLRFLSFKGTQINHLPSYLANLVCLQTLDLRFSCFPARYDNISNLFGKMEELRHLYLPWTFKIGQGQQLALGKKLHTLVNVPWGSFDLNSVVGTSLKKLYIRVNEDDTDPWKNLETFLELSSSRSFLSLSFLSVPHRYVHSSDLVSKFRFVYKLELTGWYDENSTEKLPAGLSSFPNLMKLKLSHTDNLTEDQMAILENLPHLKALYLSYRVFSSLTSDTLVCTNGGFPNLEYLSLRWTENIRNICLQEGAMPLLRRLRIEYCKGLSSIPEGLEHLANLKELTVDLMPSEFCARLGEDGEDFHKIKHVPSLIITGTERRDKMDADLALRIAGVGQRT